MSPIRRSIANNPKASFNYFLEDRFEAGLELTGPEVKSIKLGKVSIKESYVRILKNEAYILGMHITAYKFADIKSQNIRNIRLLLHRREIKKLIGSTTLKGYTLVPTSLYEKRGLIKLEIALGKGKKLYDKRETIKKRDIQRDMQRDLKS